MDKIGSTQANLRIAVQTTMRKFVIKEQLLGEGASELYIQNNTWIFKA